MPAFVASAWARTFCKDSKNKNKNRVRADKNERRLLLAAIMEQCAFRVFSRLPSHLSL